MDQDPRRRLHELLDSIVAPALQERGFAGRGLSFHKSEGDVWILVSMHVLPRFPLGLGPPTSISATADLGVASRKLLEAAGRSGVRTPRRGDWHRDLRLGTLLKPAYDRWWTIDAEMDVGEQKAVVDDFKNSLVDHGLPAIEVFASDAKLVASWRAEINYLSPPERRWFEVLSQTVD